LRRISTPRLLISIFAALAAIAAVSAVTALLSAAAPSRRRARSRMRSMTRSPVVPWPASAPTSPSRTPDRLNWCRHQRFERASHGQPVAVGCQRAPVDQLRRRVAAGAAVRHWRHRDPRLARHRHARGRRDEHRLRGHACEALVKRQLDERFTGPTGPTGPTATSGDGVPTVSSIQTALTKLMGP